MITTITPTTLVTLGTSAADSLPVIALLTLLVLLIQKEVLSGLDGSRAETLSRLLNVAITPLAIVVIVSMVLRLTGGQH